MRSAVGRSRHDRAAAVAGPPGPDPRFLAGTWQLVPGSARVTFRTRALAVVPVRGTVGLTAGSIEVDGAGHASGTLSFDPASIDTGIRLRDRHLRARDHFDVAAHPTIVFTARTARPAPSGTFEVDGDLVVRGRSTPVQVTAAVRLDGDVATVTTEVVVTRRMLGFTVPTPKSRVRVEAPFRRLSP